MEIAFTLLSITKRNHMKKTTQKQCCECQDGEHENYNDDVRYVVIRDPDTKKIYRSGYICMDHIYSLEDLGYKVKERGVDF
jgi:hypothetical protein